MNTNKVDISKNPGIAAQGQKNVSLSEILEKYSGQIAAPERTQGEIIGKIISSSMYLKINTPIEDAAKILGEYEDMYCFGIIDDNMICKGVLLRKDLFDLLGQQYGRDLYRKKPVEMVMREIPNFDFNKNIFSVAEELKYIMNVRVTAYFTVCGNNGKYAGVFSTRDLLVYLSEITTRDLNLAKKIQLKITKDSNHFENDLFEIGGGSRMARGIGGDFYFVKEYVPGKYIFALCDVSGKGVSASLVSTVLGGIFSIYDFRAGVKSFIEKLNSYILETFESEKFVTAVIVDYHAGKGVAAMYDMGHSITRLYRNGQLYQLHPGDKSSLPLGVAPDIASVPVRFRLREHDILMLMSDGIEEQLNPEGEQYGSDRIKSLVAQNRCEGLSQLKDALFRDVDDFRGSYPQYDDMTLLLIRSKGSLLPSG